MKRFALIPLILLSSCAPLVDTLNEVLDASTSVPATSPAGVPTPAPTPPKAVSNIAFTSTFYYGNKQMLIAVGNGKDIGFEYGSGLRDSRSSVTFKAKDDKQYTFSYPDKINFRVSYDDFPLTEWKVFDGEKKTESGWQKLN
jgi:hypothetical protein